MMKAKTPAEIAAHAEWLARHEQAAADAFRRRIALWEAEHNPVARPVNFDIEVTQAELEEWQRPDLRADWDDLP